MYRTLIGPGSHPRKIFFLRVYRQTSVLQGGPRAPPPFSPRDTAILLLHLCIFLPFLYVNEPSSRSLIFLSEATHAATVGLQVGLNVAQWQHHSNQTFGHRITMIGLRSSSVANSISKISQKGVGLYFTSKMICICRHAS